MRQKRSPAIAAELEPRSAVRAQAIGLQRRPRQGVSISIWGMPEVRVVPVVNSGEQAKVSKQTLECRSIGSLSCPSVQVKNSTPES